MQKRVLVLDDEPGILMSFKEMLQSETVLVDTAASVKSAEALLLLNDYSAVILDVRLGGSLREGGMKVLRFLKEQRPGTGAIVATGFGNPESMQEAFVLGAAFYFQKPVSINTLQNALRSLGV
ncbi:MAG: response regulator [Nitrospirae bacterium]|nr:response regulator [Nitrospirota bacterium]